ncbi:MAG TPA: hypothetical protein VJP86_11010, partial [Vicinamibacterales bacterium]|nr:hypothetical protein [Vicinamibacterales bacterium]
MAAMMPMIATTISSSIRVNPSFFWIFFTTSTPSDTRVRELPEEPRETRRHHAALSNWNTRAFSNVYAETVQPVLSAQPKENLRVVRSGLFSVSEPRQKVSTSTAI